MKAQKALILHYCHHLSICWISVHAIIFCIEKNMNSFLFQSICHLFQLHINPHFVIFYRDVNLRLEDLSDKWGDSKVPLRPMLLFYGFHFLHILSHISQASPKLSQFWGTPYFQQLLLSKDVETGVICRF